MMNFLIISFGNVAMIFIFQIYVALTTETCIILLSLVQISLRWKQ